MLISVDVCADWTRDNAKKHPFEFQLDHSSSFCPSLNPSLIFMELHTNKHTCNHTWKSVELLSRPIYERHYVLHAILPAFASFTNEFSSILRFSPFSLFIYLHILILPSRTPFFLPLPLVLHLLTHPLPPPSSPPVKIPNFHPPRLCIPPEGRLSSFPISSRSLSPLSFPRLSYSLYRLCAKSHRKHTHPLRHTLSCHLSTLSARMERNFPTCLPTAHSRFFMSNPTTPEQAVPQPSVSPPISRGAARFTESHPLVI